MNRGAEEKLLAWMKDQEEINRSLIDMFIRVAGIAEHMATRLEKIEEHLSGKR